MLSIAGIASAEFEGGDDAPEGVRVQLAAGADAESVGREVQRILASHGMRSHRANEQAAAVPSADVTPSAASPAPDHFQQPGPPPPPGADSNGGAVFRLPGVQQPAEQQPVMQFQPEIESVQVVEDPAPMVLESVSVEESREGIAVRVVAGTASVTRQVSSNTDGMDAAIVGALTELLGLEAELLQVQRGEAGDARIVTVLVEVAGAGRQVGSAVITAGETFAVGQAAWRALTAPE